MCDVTVTYYVTTTISHRINYSPHQIFCLYGIDVTPLLLPIMTSLKRDRSEMARRFRTFSASARFVHKANNSGEGVKYAMTKYADTSEKEMFPGLGRRTKQ